MITTVYEIDMKSHLNSDDWYWSKIEFISYTVSVERKIHIYLSEKQKAVITKFCVVDDQEVFKLLFFNLRSLL